MKHKWPLILLAGIVVLSLLVGGFIGYFHWAFRTSFQKTEIKEGFSPELLEELQTQYGITIPEEAQFIKGYNLPGWQDSYVAILFEYPLAQSIAGDSTNFVRQLLKLDSTRYPGFGSDRKQFHESDWYDELGGTMEFATGDGKYTTISYTAQQSKIIIRIIGWRPGEEFP